MRSFVVALCLSSLGCSHFVQTPEFPQAELDPARSIAAYGRVLQEFVNDKGQVDFAGLASHRADLDHYVAYVSQTPFAEFQDPKARLAHYLNAYNALSMFNVIAAGIPDSNSGFAKFRFFFLTKYRIGGEKMSLYTFENDVIRKVGDERVHFALNCMSVSCPRLPREVFRADDLDAVLDKGAKFFFSESRNLTVDNDKRVIFVSKILDFYTEDFLRKAPTLREYIDKWHSPALPADYKVKFFEYDWTMNNSARL